MPTVDGQHHEIRIEVVVLGGANEVFLAPLGLENGELQLREVQTYRPRFVFVSFPVDPWSDDSKGAALEKLIPYLDALVLTDGLGQGMHYSSAALERLSRVLRPGKIAVPTAIFGSGALTQEWATLSGVPPLHIAEPHAENALPTVKALAKVLLSSHMRSQPPPNDS